MSSTGKKGKKKSKTLPLNEFLGPSDGVVTIKSGSWAEELDEADATSSLSQTVTKVSLPSAPRSSRPMEIDESLLPSGPPYTVKIKNLSYEVREADVEDFFAEFKVANIRLLRDNNDPKGRISGTGFVEFEDRESLIQALSMPQKHLKSRPLHIEISDSYGDPKQRRQRTIDDIKRSIPADEDDRTDGNWRSGHSRSSPTPRHDSRGGYATSSYGSNDSGYYRDRRRNDRNDYDRGDRYDRYRHDDDRRGDSDRNYRRDGGGYGNRRDGYHRRDGGGYHRRDDGDRRGYREDRGWDGEYRRGGDYSRRDDDRGGFRGNDRRGGGYRRDDSSERPKLVIEKRTALEPVGSMAKGSAAIFGEAKPVDTSKKEKEVEERLMNQKTEAPAAPRHSKPSSSSIFGDAKPVDTTAKVMEVEERLLRMEIEKGQLDEGEGEKKRQQHRSGQSRPMNRGGGHDSRRDHDRNHDSRYNNKKGSAYPPSKVIDQDPPNIIASNKYSSLQDLE